MTPDQAQALIDAINSQQIAWAQAMSFLAGLLTAMAVVLGSQGDY